MRKSVTSAHKIVELLHFTNCARNFGRVSLTRMAVNKCIWPQHTILESSYDLEANVRNKPTSKETEKEANPSEKSHTTG